MDSIQCSTVLESDVRLMKTSSAAAQCHFARVKRRLAMHSLPSLSYLLCPPSWHFAGSAPPIILALMVLALAVAATKSLGLESIALCGRNLLLLTVANTDQALP